MVYSDQYRYVRYLLGVFLPLLPPLLPIHSCLALRYDESGLFDAEFLHAERSPDVDFLMIA